MSLPGTTSRPREELDRAGTDTSLGLKLRTFKCQQLPNVLLFPLQIYVDCGAIDPFLNFRWSDVGAQVDVRRTTPM